MLDSDVNFLTFSLVLLEGTAQDPVRIDRLDAGAPWGVFGIVSISERSVLNHVILKGGGSGTQSVFKAISAGEQSRIDIVNARIQNSEFGIVAKDLSVVKVFATSISGNNLGLAAYRKKPIFGSGIVEMYGGLLWGNAEDFFIDKTSSVTLNGMGVEREPHLSRVKSRDLRVGEITNLYKQDENGNPLPVSLESLPVNFMFGPQTSGISIANTQFPDLSQYPLGMMSPLGSIQ
ncbi:MAG: hypothetical protein JKY80_01505 [Mariprofundaceae bacterium]|nr:hypothetical protein [Mariprofundaceae bacterium]